MIPTRLVVGALEESGDPNGEKAERGPGAIMSSGFGEVSCLKRLHGFW